MLSKAIIIKEKDIFKVKSSLAIKLHEQGLTQSEISSILNITQPMVSKYLSQKESPLYIQKIVEKTLSAKEEKGKIKFAYVAMQNDVNQSQEYYISSPENIRINEKSAVIQNISDALNLIYGKDISMVIPNVKMNLAMSIKNPSAKGDVASVPGGLITINNQLKKVSEPEFGISRHLSQILLYANGLFSEIHAVLNIKYSPEILKKIKSLKLRCLFFSQNYTTAANKKFDILIHRGSFGIEPMCYIFGKDAVETAEKCLKLRGE